MEHLTLNRRVSKTEYLSLKQTKKTNPKNFVIHRGRKLILKNYSKMTDQTKLKLDAIIKVIDKTTRANVKTGNRERHNVDARQIYFKIVHDHLRIPISHSARYINKNHATGIHNLKQFKNYMETDKHLRNKYQSVIALLDDFDFEVDKTDTKDILEDYVSLMKEHKQTKEKLEEVTQNQNNTINDFIEENFNRLDKEILSNILLDRSIGTILYQNLYKILEKRNTSTNLNTDF